MHQFVHLHTHSQYSLLDGQASISRLVDKALGDGMPGIAITDHGNMFGIKEFWNYVDKKNGAKHANIKSLTKLKNQMVELLAAHPDLAAYKGELAEQIAAKQAVIDSSATYSLEDNEALSQLKGLFGAVESMEKEFGFSADYKGQRIEHQHKADF